MYYHEGIKILTELSFDLNYSLGIVYTMLNDFQNAKMTIMKKQHKLIHYHIIQNIH